ncbi:outer membrane beta-barrel protein [Pedobacter sp. Hv1]|uniref:outer membrane beta-barrel protein n=1 Tax=Pedobacter sp. Hv1 TaxID=1740090 RepID=UPI0006D891A7|nr:outer membrane beta-barrel protein [Pedobacter sp. Hv1]KQB99380.1 hypothetical protein AQF98_17560 [Pedobacter sp. Hv1]
MKKILFLFALVLTSNFLFAQKGSVTGVLMDSTDHKLTLNFATISIFKGADTVLTTYKLSDDKGVFKINNLDFGVKYRLVVNAWMYGVLRKEVILNASEPNVNLGNVFLSPKSNTLNEIVVLSERPPVIVRKDTIEFNAESFKTLPTAVVEDLLKKLPGVAIASDGSIQVNGKTVSKILVEGKEFFGGDQQIATKNLPANIIDKIQVSDDKEAKRNDPDLLASNTPQVINLKLKKAIKQGAFGKIFAGGGPNERYETGAIMSFFRDTTQVSLLAYSNNINRPGFGINDVMRIGGFQRMGVNSIMVNSDGGFELNGMGFGGTTGGIQQSSGAGANFNTLTKKGIKLNGRYFFGQSNTTIEQLLDIDQTIKNGRLLTATNSNQLNKNYNHVFGAKAEIKLDSLTTLTIEPSVNLNIVRNANVLLSQNRNASNQLLSDGVNNIRNQGDNTSFLIIGNLWKDFKKAGRSFNASFNVSKKNNFGNNYNASTTNFYDPVSIDIKDQLRDNDVRNFNTFLNFNYNEPISKKLSLTLASSGNYIDNENALATFYRDPLSQAYDIAVPDFTQTVAQSGIKTNNRASLKWKITKDLNIQPGFVFNTIDLKNSFNSSKYPDFEQNFKFMAPMLTIRYKDLSINYSPSFREPDVNYVQPIANNTNPLFIQNGNSNLKPAKTHQIGFNLYKYDTKNSLNYNANLYGNVDYDGIIMARTIDNKTGVQTSTPINADGIYRFNANFSITKEFKNTKRQLSIGTGFWSNYTRNIVQVDGERSYAYILGFNPRANIRLNLNDKFELSESYNLGINSSKYDSPIYKDINYLTHNSETELIVRWPKKMVWETTYRILYNTQTVAGANNNIKIWNAALTLLFMKNDRAQLKFAVNDILNTNTRRNIYINENSIRDARTSNLGRHGLVTLTYNIQNFGGKVGGKDTFFRF